MRTDRLLKIALVAMPVLAAAPFLFAGKVLYWGTPFLQFVPWRDFAVQSLLQGELPYWNPYSGMGAPLIANYQSAIFYPFTWLLLVLQAAGGVTWQAWGQGVVIVIHWIIAAIGTALLLQRLGVNKLAQVTGGLAFSLSGYLVGRAGFLSINAATAWLPWLVLCSDRLTVIRESRQPSLRSILRRLLELALVMTLLLLAGHAQTAWYSLLFAFAWGIFRSYIYYGFGCAFEVFGLFIATGVIAACLASPQLLPTLEYLQQSQRAGSLDYAYTVNFSFWPWRLLTLVAPDLFGSPAAGDYWLKSYVYEEAVYLGIVPFLLAAGIIGRSFFRKKGGDAVQPDKRQSRLVWFLLAVIVVAFIIAMGQFTPVFNFLYTYLPTFNMFQAPARFTLPAVFSLSLLAGLGINNWSKPAGKGLYWTRLFTAGSVAVGIGAGLAWAVMGSVRPTFIEAAAMLGLWLVGAGILALTSPSEKSGRRYDLWCACVILWISADLITAGWKLNPTAPVSIYTEAEHASAEMIRQVGSQRIYIPGNLETQVKFEKVFKVDSWPDSPGMQILSAAVLPNSNLYSQLYSVNNFDPLTTGRYQRWMQMVDNLPEDDRLPWLEMMDVAQYAAGITDGKGYKWEQVDRGQHYRWSTCAVAASDENDAFMKITSRAPGMGSSPLESLPVILEGWTGLDAGDCSLDALGEIQVIDRNNNSIQVEVGAKETAWLVEAETWYPGWSATLDGNQVTLYRADYLFRAVEIPPGDHKLVISYQPTYGMASKILSILVSLTIIVIYSCLALQRKQKAK